MVKDLPKQCVELKRVTSVSYILHDRVHNTNIVNVTYEEEEKQQGLSPHSNTTIGFERNNQLDDGKFEPEVIFEDIDALKPTETS